MRRKEIKIKAFSGDSYDKWFSFDKEEFEFIVATNAELAKMVTEKDQQIADLEHQEEDKRILADLIDNKIKELDEKDDNNI